MEGSKRRCTKEKHARSENGATGDEMGDGWDEFWAAYPRKEARKDAMKAWAMLTTEQKFQARESIPLHVRYWAASGRTRQYVPLPATWLRGERWTDELEMPQAPEEAQWWKTTSGIEAKARAIGIHPRAGEDWHSLKARILAAERAA